MPLFERQYARPVRKLSRTKVVLPRSAFAQPRKGLSFRSCVQLFFTLVAAIIFFLTNYQFEVVNETPQFQGRRAFDFREEPQTKMKTRGTAIVAACQDRHEELRNALSSWLDVKGVNEIVVVDWNSKVPLQYVVEEMDRMGSNRPRITVAYISNGGDWNPPAAYNIGFRLARNKKILRVDCDHRVNPSFVEDHYLWRGRFFSGHDKLARSDDEEHLSDVMYTERDTLLLTGGYDERLKLFGGEQVELSRRLRKLGISSLNISYDGLKHDVHENKEEQGTSFSTDVKEAEAEINIGLLHRVEPWNQLSRISSRKLFSGNITAQSFRHSNVQYLNMNLSHPNAFPSIRKLVPAEHVCSQREEFYGALLNEKFRVPSCISKLLHCDTMVELTNLLSAKMATSFSVHPPRGLFLYCDGDLIDRLRLLATGLSFARETGRLAFVFWPTLGEGKRHESSSFSGLFSAREGMTVFENIKQRNDSELCSTGPSSLGMVVYNAKKQTKRTIVKDDPHKHIFLRSSFPVRFENIRHANQKSDRLHLLSLGLYSTVQTELERLDTAGLRESLGVYVPGSAPTEGNALAIKYLMAIQQHIQSQDEVDLDLGALYVDAPAVFSERLMNVTKRLLEHHPSDSCLVSSCSTNQLLRMLALARAKSFFTPVEDKFSTFVHFLRGEHPN